jgi:hypothetical protein
MEDAAAKFTTHGVLRPARNSQAQDGGCRYWCAAVVAHVGIQIQASDARMIELFNGDAAPVSL